MSIQSIKQSGLGSGKFQSVGGVVKKRFAEADFLVIAGGGAGGGGAQPGGGAGGYRSSWNNETSGGGGASESPQAIELGRVYTCTVGGGGARATDDTSGSLYSNTNTNDSTAGSNSVFADITSIGGGCGGADTSTEDLVLEVELLEQLIKVMMVEQM